MHPESGLKVLLPVHESYQKAANLNYYHLTHKSVTTDDDVASGMQNMRKKIAIQVKTKAISRKELIYAIKSLTKFKKHANPTEFTEMLQIGSFESL